MNKTLRTNLVATNVLVIIHRLIERSSTTTLLHNLQSVRSVKF